jgi:hypothetical protein
MEKIRIELTSEEGKTVLDILKKQIGKTEWVLGNKDVQNEDFLQKRIDIMNAVIKQIEDAFGVSGDEYDFLDS